MTLEEKNGLIAQQLKGTGFIGSCAGLFRDQDSGSVKIANGVPILYENQIRDNGVEERSTVEVLFFAGNKVSAPCVIPQSDLDSKTGAYFPTWFRPEIGKNSRAYIVDCIKAQSEEMEDTRIFTHTGIKKLDGETVFLFPGGALTAQGIDKNVKTELGDRLTLYDFTTERNPERWDTYRKFLEVAPHRVTFPLLAFAVLAPLHEAFRRGGKEPSFVLHLYGTTQSGKTNLAALTMSFFGAKFSERLLPSNFRTTLTTIEGRGFSSKDILTVIDDFHPRTRMEMIKQTELFQDISRMYGDKQVKGRSNSNLTMQAIRPPRGNAMTTGESIPNLGESGVARLFLVKLTPPNKKTREGGDVNFILLSKLFHEKIYLNQIMSEFIQWLLPQYDELPERLIERFEELREEAGAHGHGRITEAVAHLQTAFELWCDFLQESAQIDEAERDQMCQEAWEGFLLSANRQEVETGEERPTEIFCNAMRELILTHEIKFQDLKTGKTDKELRDELDRGLIDLSHYNSQIGWEDRSFYYMLPGKAISALKQYCTQQDSHFPFGKNDLARMLEEDGILERGKKSNSRDVYVGQNGGRDTVWWVYKNAIFKNEEESEE